MQDAVVVIVDDADAALSVTQSYGHNSLYEP